MRSEAFAIALAALTAVACASGEDKDGATTFVRPGGDNSFDDLDDGGSFGDDEGGDEGPAGTSGDPKAGSVSDSSDPTDPTDPGDTGMDPVPPPPGDPPPMMPPPDVAPCEAFCMVLAACGLDPDIAGCVASECIVTDGGACDAAFNNMYICVASQPDCAAVGAWWNSVPGYPCEAQDAQIGPACF